MSTRTSLLRAGALAILLAPLSVSQSPFVAFEGPSAGDAAGTSVALLGDLDGDDVPDFAVGAPGADLAGPDAGAVWVLSGADGSVLHVFAGGAPGDQFGAAVANVGDVDADGLDDIGVGAPQDHVSSSGWAGEGPGYAQVLSGADGTLLHMWQGQHRLSPDFASFGRVIVGVGDLDGDGHDDVAVSERDCEVELLHDLDPVGGRVWVYSGADGTVLRRIEAVGPIYAHLGWSLAGGRDLDADGTPDLLLGAPIFNEGEIRLVVVSGATSLPLLQIESETWRLGMNVSFLDDVDGDGVPEVLGAGRNQAVLYSGATGALLHETTSFPTDEPYDGVRVSAVGDADGDGVADWALGAPDASGAAPGAGIVHLYSGADGHSIFVVVGTQDGGALGSAVVGTPDLDGDDRPELLIGSPGVDGIAGAGSGVGGLYSTHAPFLHLAVYSPNAVDTDFGQRVAAVGDVDNDGWGDVAVGLPYDSQAFHLAGRVQVFSGRDGALLHEFAGLGAYDRLGWSVAGAGDVDGDGHGDIIAGSPYYAPGTGPAYARVWSGRDGSLLHHFDGHVASDQFGTGVAGVGDLDGDGRDDVAIGAPNDYSAGTHVGKVFVYSGSTGDLLVQLPGTSAFADFGASIAAAGDVDADGTPDVIVGARTALTVHGVASGLARVHSGADGGVLHEFLGDSSGDQAGWSVAGMGDLNGDGRDDVAVGIPFAPAATSDSGVVRLYSGLDGSVLLDVVSDAGDAPFGRTIANVGDFDLDGAADLAVGLSSADDVAGDAGAVRIYSGVDGELLVVWPGPFAGNLAGWSIGSEGDVDNDGTRDVVVGAFASPEHPAPAGAVYVINLDPADTPWQSLGARLPGIHGAPLLVGSGPLEPATLTTLSLVNALENTTSTLVLGTVPLNAPFKGGTMVPFPQILVSGLPTGPSGAIEVSALWPPGLPPGLMLHAQHWIADPAGPAGLSASNAVVGTVP